MINIKLSDRQLAVFKDTKVVVVTGKGDNSTIFIGHQETVIKFQVSEADYEELSVGNKLNIDGTTLHNKPTQEQVQQVKEQTSVKKSNSSMAPRFPR